MLLALRWGKIQHFCDSIVILLQEVICDSRKFHAEMDDLQMFFGNRPEDWRGTAVEHSANAHHTRGKILSGAVSCILTADTLRFSALTVHIPHHATLSQIEQILQAIEPHMHDTHKVVMGMDTKETFSAGAQRKQITVATTCGDMLLRWLDGQHMHLPL